ncbi:MAG TPA: phosphate ABC transporter permease PstA [Actinomycetota bacterium]|nr:phosphate ABC transporter permease PstA [Actinomycetota bacterium]
MTVVQPVTSPIDARNVPAPAEDKPRPLRARTTDDVLSVVGSFLGSGALVWLIYFQILPLSGVLGFLICWYAAFLAMFAGVTSLSHPKPVVVSRLMGAAITGAFVVVVGAVASVVIYTFDKGWHVLPHWNFYTRDMAGVGVRDPVNKGGILHAVIGSFEQVGIAVAVSLPLGLITAVFMTEVGGPITRVVRTVVEAMTAIPDLLAGLFVYVLLIVGLGMSRTGFAAAIAIAVTMTPIIARSAEVSLRVVPGGLREAGLALGASHWQTVRRVVLPTARPGLATALILAIARGIGETAPLLIVSGASTFTNANPISQPQNSLPLFIYQAVRSPEPLQIERGFGAACVLLIIVFILFAITRFLARQRVGRS